MLMSSFFKNNHNLNLNRKIRHSRSRQRVIKVKNDNVCAKSCTIEKIVNTLLNLSNHQIENAINKKQKNWKTRFWNHENASFSIKKIIDTNILNDIKTKDCYKKNSNDNNDKKIDNEKTTENDISNVKFANMTNLRLFKYASMFINKTFNNLLWKALFTILIVMIHLFMIWIDS
jgi:hypothetical protein